MESCNIKMAEKSVLDVLPHRPPMLMVDSIVSMDESTIVAQKYIKADNFFFDGHFPDNPIMPGVMILECMAQASALLGASIYKIPNGTMGVRLITMDNVKFRAPVYPDSTIIMKATITQNRSKFAKFTCFAHVLDTFVAEAEMLAMIVI